MKSGAGIAEEFLGVAVDGGGYQQLAHALLVLSLWARSRAMFTVRRASTAAMAVR